MRTLAVVLALVFLPSCQLAQQPVQAAGRPLQKLEGQAILQAMNESETSFGAKNLDLALAHSVQIHQWVIIEMMAVLSEGGKLDPARIRTIIDQAAAKTMGVNLKQAQFQIDDRKILRNLLVALRANDKLGAWSADREDPADRAANGMEDLHKMFDEYKDFAKVVDALKIEQKRREDEANKKAAEEEAAAAEEESKAAEKAAADKAIEDAKNAGAGSGTGSGS